MTVLRGKAPLRISFAGGGTDINEVFEKYGGAVINSTIDKFTHMTIEDRNDKRIFVNGIELFETDDFTQRVVRKVDLSKGVNIWYHNEVPPGRGLGSSSAYSILLTKLLLEMKENNPDDRTLVERVYGVESEAGKCGWQDQFATAVGGFNYMNFSKDKIDVYSLRLKHRTICDLEEHLLMVYTKQEHNSGQVQVKNVKLVTEERANQLKDLAEKIKDSLLNSKIDGIGSYLHNAWLAKRNSSNTNPDIDKMYETGLQYGAKGGKLIGAGVGGYMLFFANPRDIPKLKERFRSIRYDTMDFHFTEKGVETWKVE